MRLRWRLEKMSNQVQAFRPHGSDPSLIDGIGMRRPDGSANHQQALSRKHLIEGTAELCVSVVDEKPERLCPLVEVEGEVSCLLDAPGAVGVSGATGEMDRARWRAR